VDRAAISVLFQRQGPREENVVSAMDAPRAIELM